jgi:hypothetical protein
VRQPALLTHEHTASGVHGTLPLIELLLMNMDQDLEQFTREELITEIKKLRAGIRVHRDSSKHELCWHHPQLWNLLPEKITPHLAVPAWPQFLRGCLQYRESLDIQLANAPRLNEEYDGSLPKPDDH